MTTNTFNRTLYRGLMIAGIATLPFALTGCFPSSSSGKGTAPDPDPGVISDFIIDFMGGAPQVDWGNPHTVTAFTPAQRSWEWATAGAHPPFAQMALNAGAACTDCHDGSIAPAPAELGTRLVGADEDPIPGKRPSVDITVQAAYDAETFYLKASWQAGRPGITHDIFTYQDGAWVRNSHEKPADLEDNEVYSVEDRIGVMFLPFSTTVPAAAGHASDFHSIGCWVTCHSDMHDMPDADYDNYTYGDEITKYLTISRVGNGGATAPLTDTAALKGAGLFPDMWHFRGARSAPVQTLTDGYVLDTRASDSGSHAYSTNTMGEGGWMYDAEWMAAFIAEFFPDYEGETAVSAFPGALWDDALENAPPLTIAGEDANAVPFDPGAAFSEGDIIPRRTLTPREGDSRNDVKAYSSWEDGVWTVIFERARDTGNPDDHVLNPTAENYTFAFSIFEDHSGGRWHHVTFPVTLGTEGSDVDIAARLNP